MHDFGELRAGDYFEFMSSFPGCLAQHQESFLGRAPNPSVDPSAFARVRGARGEISLFHQRDHMAVRLSLPSRYRRDLRANGVANRRPHDQQVRNGATRACGLGGSMTTTTWRALVIDTYNSLDASSNGSFAFGPYQSPEP